MITRRQFLVGCAGAIATAAGLSLMPELKVLDAILQSIPILLYHRVGIEPDDLTVSTQRFQADLEYLCLAGYNTLTLDQIKQYQVNPSLPLPEKPIAITFDDGYLDNYTNAFPLLQKFSMTASFYIITGMLGKPDRMTASQIREMEIAGMNFGSHTITHRSLAELSSAEIEVELAESKSELEEIVGKCVDFVAYPCGSYNADTLRIAQENGYKGGFSVRPGYAMFNNPLTIRRMPIFHNDRPISYVMLRKGLLPDLWG